MGMQFTVAVTGDVTFEANDSSVADSIDADSILQEEVGYSSDVQFEDAEVIDASITIRARARLEDYEVLVADLQGFDADMALSESIHSYNVEVRNADYEVTDSPEGFEVVVDATDRDTAIEVYVALNAAGLTVS